MAQIKAKEIRELSVDEINGKLKDLKQEALNLRLQQSTGQLDNPARLKVIRREVAKYTTVLNEKNS